MNNTASELNYQRRSALAAGVSLVIMAVAATFSYGFIMDKLVAADDAAVTLSNLQTSSQLFLAGILGWMIILLCDIVAAWALYIFLKPTDHYLSLLGACLRFVYCAILGIAISHLVLAYLLSRSTLLVSIEQLHTHTMLYVEAFEFTWSIGLVLFGGHLLIIGYLAFKNDRIPKVLGILMVLAAVGYIVIHLGATVLPFHAGVLSMLELVFLTPMIAGELGFGVWLLLRGGKL
jgi:hypothetical protein